jgi:class 3 adenylate cyclase
MTVAPAPTAQTARVIEIAHSTEPRESAELLERWCLAMPQAVHVVTDPAGGVAAAYVLLEVNDAPADLLAADPVTASWADHLRRSPVAEGERVLFLRRWLDRDTGELLTPALGACWLDVKRTYMELRPDLRRLYTTVRHPDAYPYQALKLVPLPGEPAVMLGGADYLTLMIDFGPNSVDGWLCGLVGFELGVDDDDRRGTLPEGTVTILFTDIVGSTALTERVGDAAFRSMAREVERSLRQAVGETGGTVVEGTLLGDGLMAVFTSAGQAVSCGLRGAACGGQTGLELRVGLHAGDVIRDGNNVFGGAVNIAARVASAAAPGEVLVSDTVRSLARTSAGVQFEDRGAHEMKGVADAQRLHAVVVVREASTV